MRGYNWSFPKRPGRRCRGLVDKLSWSDSNEASPSCFCISLFASTHQMQTNKTKNKPRGSESRSQKEKQKTNTNLLSNRSWAKKNSTGSFKLSRSKVGSKLSTEGLLRKTKSTKNNCKRHSQIEWWSGLYKPYFVVGFIEKRGRLSPNPGLCCRRKSPSSPAPFVVWKVESCVISEPNRLGLSSKTDLASCTSFAGLRKACANTVAWNGRQCFN